MSTGPEQPEVKVLIEESSRRTQILLSSEQLQGLSNAAGRLGNIALTAERIPTPEQIEVIDLISRGMSEDEVADSLGIAISTVAGRLQAAYRKLDVHSIVGATISLFNLDLLPLVQEYKERPVVPLEKRQVEVMTWVLEGLSYQAIAEKMYLSPGRISNLIKEVVQESGAESAADAVRYYLQQGGPELRTKSEKDKATFLKASIEEIPVHYGMYSEWIAKIFINFPNRPFTVEDIAKVLYAEDFNEADRLKFIRRTKTLLDGALKPSGAKGSIPRVKEDISEHGLEMSKIEVPVKNILAPRDRYIAHEPGAEINIEKLEDNRVSETELRKFALKLRRGEWRKHRKLSISETRTFSQAVRQILDGLHSSIEGFNELDPGLIISIPNQEALVDALANDVISEKQFANQEIGIEDLVAVLLLKRGYSRRFLIEEKSKQEAMLIIQECIIARKT